MNPAEPSPHLTAEIAQKQLTSLVRWRLVFAILAVVLPFVPYTLLERQARRLDALVDHGKEVEATVTRVALEKRETYLTYSYVVDGASFSWTVPSSQVPHAPGESFRATYLPEDPSLSRPDTDGTLATRDADAGRSLAWKIMLGVFAFFIVNALIADRKVRDLRKRAPAGVVFPSLSPIALGRFVALGILALVLMTNLNEQTASVQAKAFGAAPLGVSIVVWTSLLEIALFTPYFWVFPHFMQIVFRARRDRAPLTRGGLVWYVANVNKWHPDLARSRAITLAGFVYFITLVASWIAYASHRGI